MFPDTRDCARFSVDVVLELALDWTLIRAGSNSRPGARTITGVSTRVGNKTASLFAVCVQTGIQDFSASSFGAGADAGAVSSPGGAARPADSSGAGASPGLNPGAHARARLPSEPGIASDSVLVGAGAGSWACLRAPRWPRG